MRVAMSSGAIAARFASSREGSAGSAGSSASCSAAGGPFCAPSAGGGGQAPDRRALKRRHRTWMVRAE